MYSAGSQQIKLTMPITDESHLNVKVDGCRMREAHFNPEKLFA